MSIKHRIKQVLAHYGLRGSPWERRHPFDRAHGTDTSGFVAASELQAGAAERAQAVCYAGSQPSIIRTALATVPAPERCTLVDLGCGKGRVLCVASELPFRDIVGVELSPPLAEVARANAAVIARRFPARTLIRVEVGDASRYALPAGDLVIYLYHPFSAVLVERVAERVAQALAEPARRVFVVYYNPVAGACFDAVPGLERAFARTLPYAAEERGFGPDPADTVVIWRSDAPAAADAAASIIVRDGMRAALA